jgi:hypothetical protein
MRRRIQLRDLELALIIRKYSSLDLRYRYADRETRQIHVSASEDEITSEGPSIENASIARLAYDRDKEGVVNVNGHGDGPPYQLSLPIAQAWETPLLIDVSYSTSMSIDEAVSK